MKKKILLIGSNGQLGRCIKDRVLDNWELASLNSTQLNLCDLSELGKIISECKPDVIINSAAYTAVDLAETEKDLAYQINSHAPGVIAEVCKKNNIKFIHISTDYVFSGDGTLPYDEESITAPKSIYGLSKLSGEQNVLSANPEAVVIRTAWVFSEYGKNFVKTMLNLANTKEEISVVDDQLGCPTYAGDLANAILKSAEIDIPGGVYHYCGSEAVTWKVFAERIFHKVNGLNKPTKKIVIKSIKTSDYPTPAKRPQYSVMSCEKLNGFGIKASDWNKALEIVLSKLLV